MAAGGTTVADTACATAVGAAAIIAADDAGTGTAGTGTTASTGAGGGMICGAGSAAGAAAAAATPESGLLRPNNRLKNPGADSPAGALVSGVVAGIGAVAGVGAVVGVAAGGAAAGAAVFTLLVPPTATGALAGASDIAGAEPPPACGPAAVDDPPRIRRKNPGGSPGAGAATSTALGISTASHFSSFSDLSKNTVRRRFSGSFQPLAERKIKSQRS